MSIDINISLLGHILLDAELTGRFGVQGNVFANTIGYLNQYFQTLQHTISGLDVAKYKRLSKAMANLVDNENRIEQCNSQGSDDNQLNLLVQKITQQIDKIDDQCPDIMLPGGWEDINSGHAMIYQFTKPNEQTLRFSIYNSGAGIGEHEQHSALTHEAYFPVKTYDIPFFMDLDTQNIPFPPPLPLHQPFIIVPNPDNIATSLPELLMTCHNAVEADPVWVINQIEQAINQYSLGEKNLPFEQEKIIADKLMEIQKVYQKAMEKMGGTQYGITPIFYLTQCNFLALFLQYNQHNPDQKILFSRVRACFSQIVWYSNEHPNVATNNFLFDQRLMALKKQYEPLELNRPYNNGLYHLQDYKALLDEPLSEILEKRYQSIKTRLLKNDKEFFEALEAQSLQEIWYLFEQLDDEGHIDRLQTT